MTYQLILTDDDIKTIAFVGGRYCWSEALASLEAGMNEIRESDAWQIADAFANDCLGGHSAFPMLDPRSELAEKLNAFWQSIV